MSDLIPPHGGLAELVSCTVPADKVDSFLAETSSLEKVPVSDADLSTVYRFGDGALTPLTGPMDEATWNRVLDQASIESNGADYAWTIPLALPVTADLAGKLSAGQSVALTNSGGETVARLAISSIVVKGDTSTSPATRRYGWSQSCSRESAAWASATAQPIEWAK